MERVRWENKSYWIVRYKDYRLIDGRIVGVRPGSKLGSWAVYDICNLKGIRSKNLWKATGEFARIEVQENLDRLVKEGIGIFKGAVALTGIPPEVFAKKPKIGREERAL